MKKILGVLALAAILGGCVSYSASVPDGYDGPLATVKDSVHVYSVQKADFFYLSAVDDRIIKDSLSETESVNYGRGFNMTPVVLDHDIPAQECRVTIIGRTQYAAPILALTNKVYEVRGEVAFRPQSDAVYVVRGELGEDYSAVWLEEEGTGQIVGEKIEVNGSAALGFFQK